MTLLQTLAHLLRDLADRLDPYQAPVPVLPKPGDRLTVAVQGDDETYEVHGVVNVAWSDASGQAITRLVLREVRNA